MHPLDRPLPECRALVADPNPTSRSILAAQLRDLGLGSVTQCSRVQDARRHLESREFEFVLCEQHFPQDEQSGQDLLDDLRQAQSLPFSTVFVMITAEARYAKVAEAAESALDGYLLKPHTASALVQRLRLARQRKRALREILQAIEEGRYEAAADECLRRFESRGAWWLYAARLGAELLLRLGRHDEAQRLYESVIAARALPWARLGIARAQMAGRQLGPARRTLETLIAHDPSDVDAYDVMGRLQVEQGQLAGALATYRRASELTPGSLARLQKRGTLAFYLGEHEEAAQALEKAWAVGAGSKLLDLQSLVLLAFVRFRQRDGKGLRRCVDELRRTQSKAPGSVRLARFVDVGQALDDMLARRPAAVVDAVRRMARAIEDPGFDTEAGCNLLALLAELAAAELQLEDAQGWIERLSLRFAGSRSLCELLVRCAGAHAPSAEAVREGHARVQRIAEECLVHALRGDPQEAVRQMLAHAERTCSSKLAETAALTLQRHADRIDDVPTLRQEVDALRARYRGDLQVLPLAQDSAREVGGIALPRARAMAPASVPTAADG